ncbi:MAG TPA: membrane protein insertase YidC, partial [Chloroflexota bacterium]|nr:membrane protein insertase YidC [Chloroflexota bacterium]
MLNFLYVAVSWVMLRWHDLFDAIGVGANWAWVLSIVFLVITARLLLFRLFIKQVHYTRNMQKMQPKIQKLREKYKNDRAELNRQMMKLQQEEGFNPLSGCLPMFLQIPVFLGLYHVLRHLANAAKPGSHGKPSLCDQYAANHNFDNHLLSLYTFSKSETCQAAGAKIFGTPIGVTFRDSGDTIRALGGDPGSARWLLIVLLVISAAATLGTQLLVRANQTTVPEGTAATVQRLMMWVIPLGVLASGLLFNFPLGVLLYWFTSNLWTLAQQGYIIRYHPPTEEPVKPVGELGKTLAPRPGQRPVRMSKAQADGGTPDEAEQPTADSAPPAARGGTAPRPGQRPNRA